MNKRSELCACGGWVTVENVRDLSSIFGGVRRHNATWKHLRWRESFVDNLLPGTEIDVESEGVGTLARAL